MDKRTHTPNNASLVVFVTSAAFGAISIGSDTAFEAFFSGSTLAGQISYILPVLGRCLYEDNPDYHPGPYNLGRFSKPIRWIAVLWNLFIMPLSSLYVSPLGVVSPSLTCLLQQPRLSYALSCRYELGGPHLCVCRIVLSLSLYTYLSMIYQSFPAHCDGILVVLGVQIIHWSTSKPQGEALRGDVRRFRGREGKGGGIGFAGVPIQKFPREVLYILSSKHALFPLLQ